MENPVGQVLSIRVSSRDFIDHPSILDVKARKTQGGANQVLRKDEISMLAKQLPSSEGGEVIAAIREVNEAVVYRREQGFTTKIQSKENLVVLRETILPCVPRSEHKNVNRVFEQSVSRKFDNFLGVSSCG